MAEQLIKQISLNGLEYNKFRDPDNYRRAPGEDYKFKVRLAGSGSASARVLVEGQTVCEEQVSLPGSFVCTTQFASAGARVATIEVEAGDQRESREITIDIWEHAKVG